ncbi:MAG: site-specific DNA-methyltransferase [Candidatus Hodarchaeota archaeon]
MKWKGKKERNDIFSEDYENKPFKDIDIYCFPKQDLKLKEDWENILIWGENKLVMNALLKQFENKISLIYIDPPFATGGDFNLKIQIGEKGNFIDNIAYIDKWGEGLDSYLNFLYERLVLMKRLLNNRGSIYIHLDWHISHYIKLILDEIFGIDNFRNEIIWAYPAASVKTRRFFIRSYDTILFYTKSDNYVFNDDPNIYQNFSDRVKNALKRDDKGIFYYRGGSHNGKKLSRKVYVKKEGIFPRDVWNDIPYIRANTLEYQGFSTQKPERLVKRVILSSTNENDIVADFFCGTGTTLAVAEKLGRYWIGCDSNKHAIHMTRKRILNIGHSNDMINWNKNYNKSPKPFKIQSLDKRDQADLVLNTFLKREIVNNEDMNIKESPEFKTKIHQNGNRVIIELIGYKIPFINKISEKVIENIKSFSDWIDYWAIDFNSKNKIFNNMWFSYRTPKFRNLSIKSDVHNYDKPGNYKVLVKIIDIFGIETIVSYEIKVD